MNCRHCGTALRCDFLDLGFAPPSNAYLTADDLSKPEVYFPLRLQVCEECWLVQTEDYASAESLFSAEYAYFSSASTSGSPMRPVMSRWLPLASASAGTAW